MMSKSKALAGAALTMLFWGFLFGGNGTGNNSIGPFSTASASITTPDDSRNNDPPFVLLGVGLPYTGSLNLHRFLECHNPPDVSNEQRMLFDSYHYCCGNHTQNQDRKPTQFPCPKETCGHCIHQKMLQGQTEPWRGCGIDSSKSGSPQSPTTTKKRPPIQAFTTLDVETDDPYSWFLPQHFALPLLVPSHKSQTPKPIWILTQRISATVWAQSIMHWYSRTRRLFRAFNLPYHHPHRLHEKQDGSHHGESLLTVGLSHGTSQHELYQELAIGIARAQNHTLHDERQRLLENVYQSHIQRVTDFCRLHRIPLISLMVDDPEAGKHLSNELRRLMGGNNLLVSDQDEVWSFQEACWTFDANELDADWKNFTLPF